MLAAICLPLQEPEAPYPADAAEAAAAARQADGRVAELEAQEDPPRELVESARALAATYEEIRRLYEDQAHQSEALANRERRERNARAMLEEPALPEVGGGEPEAAADSGAAPRLAALEAANEAVAADIDALQARLTKLQKDREGGLAERRAENALRNEEAAERLGRLRSNWSERVAEAETPEELETLENRLKIARLETELTQRRADYLEQRAAFLPAEAEVVQLEERALEARLAAGLQRLAAAREAAQQALEADREREAREAEEAQERVEAAGDPWERRLREWQAETARMEVEHANRLAEYAKLVGTTPIKNAIDDAEARQARVRELYERQRSVGLDTDLLIRRTLAQVAEVRRRFLVRGGRAALDEQRADDAAALEVTSRDLYFLEDTWSSAMEEAREDWEAAGRTVAGAEGWDAVMAPAWREALVARREALSALEASLVRLNSELVERLGRLAALEAAIEREESWLDRRTLLLRNSFPDPLLAVERGGRDIVHWQSAAGSTRWAGLAVFVVLVVAWMALTRGVRKRLRRLVQSRRERGEKLLTWQAWGSVAGGVLWVPLAVFAGLGASWLFEAQREGAAMRDAGFLVGAVCLVWALTRGLLTLAPDETRRFFRRIALLATLAVLLLGVPYWYFLRIKYDSVNPDFVLLLGRVFRSAMALLVLAALSSKGSLITLVGGEDRFRKLRSVRYVLMTVLVAVVAADWTGYDNLAAGLFAATFGSALTLALGLAGGRSGLRAISRAIEPYSGSGQLPDERRYFLLTELRFVVRLLVAAAVVWGLVVSFGVDSTELRAMGEIRLWPLGVSALEGSSIGLTLGGLAAGALVVLVTYGLAGMSRGFLNLYLLAWTGMDRGLRFSLATVVHYIVIFLGAFFALSAVGLRLDELQWFLAAAGVGIGFGLTEVVSNFVSGVIILFERPLKVGDWVAAGDLAGEVVDVSIRATTLRTLNNHFVLVPNKEIITQRLQNYTGDDPKIRTEVPIGVAYGSDMDLVRETLIGCAREVPGVFRRPEPDVIFRGHGDSSLDLELRVWCHVMQRIRIASELRFKVDAAFRKAGVTIPFPQRDLHFKSGTVHVADEDGKDGAGVGDGGGGPDAPGRTAAEGGAS